MFYVFLSKVATDDGHSVIFGRLAKRKSFSPRRTASSSLPAAGNKLLLLLRLYRSLVLPAARVLDVPGFNLF